MINQETVLNKLDELLSRNNYSAAKEHLLYWLETAEKEADEKSILLISNELMGLCRKLGEKEEALRYAEKALDRIKLMNIENNVGAATTYLNSATVYKAFGMAEKSVPLFEKAKNIYEEKLPPSDPRKAGLYNNMALSLVDLCRFTEAKELYEKAISVLQKNENKKPEEAITYLNLASAAEAEFGLEEGENKISSYLNKAMELLDDEKNIRDGNYAFVCEKCASVFGYFGYFGYENELVKRYRSIYERS